MPKQLQQYLPFTVLKLLNVPMFFQPYGWMLQQYLPFTVLKLAKIPCVSSQVISLQQYLPFTVLKLINITRHQ